MPGRDEGAAGDAPLRAEAAVRPLRAADLPAAAALHRRVFTDHFLGHLDARFLVLFYREFVVGPNELGFVAERDGRLVGAAIGTLDAAALYRRFYRRNLNRLVPLVLRSAARDPFVRRGAFDRLPHVALAVRSRLGRAASRSASRPTASAGAGSPSARLLSIGVDAEERGTRVGEALVEAFCAALAARGVERVGLSVHHDNARAIAFYEKTGWRRERTDARGTSYWRATRRPPA